MGGRTGRSFAAERAAGDVNVFDALVAHVAALQKSGRKVMLASWSEGARDRLGQVLVDHGLLDLKPVGDWRELQALPEEPVGLAVLPLETGFEAPDIAIIGDQDVLGDRFVRAGAQAQARRRCADRSREPRAPAISSSMSTTASAASPGSAPSRRRARRTIAWRSSTPATTACSCRSRTSSS